MQCQKEHDSIGRQNPVSPTEFTIRGDSLNLQSCVSSSTNLRVQYVPYVRVTVMEGWNVVMVQNTAQCLEIYEHTCPSLFP